MGLQQNIHLSKNVRKVTKEFKVKNVIRLLCDKEHIIYRHRVGWSQCFENIQMFLLFATVTKKAFLEPSVTKGSNIQNVAFVGIE